MNIKPAMVTAAMMALIAATAISPLHAQVRQGEAGFRIGATQPQNPLSTPASPNPVQGMTTPPIQGMTTPPILPLGGSIAPQTPQPPQRSSQLVTRPLGGRAGDNILILSPGETIFVPVGTLVVENTSGLFPGAILTAPPAPNVPPTPNGSRRGGTSIERTDRTVNDDPQDQAKQDVTRLTLGTSRDKVIAKYGNPIAFIMGMNGETLYFSGGVVVFIRDGVVATPGN